MNASDSFSNPPGYVLHGIAQCGLQVLHKLLQVRLALSTQCQLNTLFL